MSTNTRILPATKIDRDKWDACVAASVNGLVYAYYDYLQHMCSNWSAIVIDDYKAIMPLPWRRKLGIRYIYQPAFIQQLGAIGETFDLSSVFSFAGYGDILLNFRNTLLTEQTGATLKTNQVIDLSRGYAPIYSRYSKDLLQNLKKAEKESLQLSSENDIDLAIKMYKLLYQDRMSGVSDKDYWNFTSLAKLFSDKGMCFTRKVKDDKGTLLAIGLFMKDNKRVYNLMNSTTDEGRKKEANHFLLDAVIREFAGQELSFDFEGSDIPGVQVFYDKFGAENQPYFLYHYNKLPAIIRWMKH